jgi:type IX secretion system PorP/SprF family membrane protein
MGHNKMHTMKAYKIIFIIMIAACGHSLTAQQIPVLNQYVFNPYLYNPARAGEGTFSQVQVSHRSQWVEMTDAPISSVLTYDMPLKGNVGIGGMLFSDETHIINNYGGMATYAYHIPFSEDKTHRLSVGLSAGVLGQRFDFTKATVEQENDVAILQESNNGVALDMAAGLNYHFKGLDVGFSVPQILNSKVAYREPSNFDNSKFHLERHYLMSVSYLARIGESFSIQPTFLGRMVSGLPFQIDGSVMFGYKDIIWLGGGYRSAASIADPAGVHGAVALRVKERFTVAYTYETVTGSEARADLGASHEFTVGYRFGKDDSRDKEIFDRLEKVEGKTDSLGGELTTVVEENEALDERVNELAEQVEKGMMDAEKLAALEARVAQNEEDIKKLKEGNAKLAEELEATKQRLNQMKNQGGGAYFDEMGSVFFQKNSYELSSEEKSKLDAISQNINTRGRQFTLFISGNASSEGPETYNMALSMRRANAVKKYLLSKGVSGGSVFLLPYGESVPKDGAVSHGNNANDRRVDIFITQ